MDNDYLKTLHPVSAVLHWKVLDILKEYDIKTVLDVGGVGKLEGLSGYEVTDVNVFKTGDVSPLNGMDGCDMPFVDNSFDATVSIATVEHVKEPGMFLQECRRVAKKVSVHWFPNGGCAEEVEALKRKYGHWHSCNLKYRERPEFHEHFIEHFTTCGEHLLLCMTITPSLKAIEIYDYILKKGDQPYGVILQCK